MVILRTLKINVSVEKGKGRPSKTAQPLPFNTDKVKHMMCDTLDLVKEDYKLRKER